MSDKKSDNWEVWKQEEIDAATEAAKKYDSLFTLGFDDPNVPEWAWEPHGDGFALYQGRTDFAHGLNRISASNSDAFDFEGEKIRNRIAYLLNKYGLEDK